jgi:hypothetical protein
LKNASRRGARAVPFVGLSDERGVVTESFDLDRLPIAMTRTPFPIRYVVALCALLGTLAVPPLASGQEQGDPAALAVASPGPVLAGTVRDALTGAPIPSATVILQPESAGAFPGPVSGSAFATATRAAASDARGAYRFDRVPPGIYRVYASAFGYRPYSIVVELRGLGPTAVSLGLDAEPVALEPMRARGHARGPYEATYAFGGDAELARMLAADTRRRHYLTTDVRELTHADVVEAVTLGEPDVFRALQRLPGVTTRSDYTAELWTRGAPWAHTRVYFDGVPLFNPLHALGMVSGIGSSALGAAWFHPGARSAGIGEGAAGVVDLQSRRGSGAGELNAQGDLSLMTAGIALDQRVLEGRAGWMLSGRRTYLDWLADLAGRAAGREDSAFPYGFSEVAGRVDAWIGDRTFLEASGLWEADELSDGGIATVDPITTRWGNTLGRLTLGHRVRGLDVRTSVASSLHHGWVGQDETGVIPSSPTARRVGESRVQYVGISGTVSPEPASVAGPTWHLGYAVEHHSAGYYGPHALPIPRPSSWLSLPPARTDMATGSAALWWNSGLPMVAAWGERVWSPDERVALRAGLRLEAGDELQNTGPLRAAPRLSARYAPLPGLALSAGLARVYQYTQALAPGGVHLASLISTDVWLVAGPNVPAIRSDIASLGAEVWIAPGRVATVNTFLRHAGGVAAPDPRPGPLLDRPTFVTGENTAYGVEASVRQLVGPVTGTASYTLTRSRVTAEGLTFPSAAERPHVLDASLLFRATPSLRLGGAFTAATGVPFTRVIGNVQECDLQPGCDPARLPWSGEPHSLRAAHHASLDLLADWSTSVSGLEVGVYAQLRNVLGRENGTIYTGSDGDCTALGCASGELGNLHERGVPRLPVLGVRVRR